MIVVLAYVLDRCRCQLEPLGWEPHDDDMSMFDETRTGLDVDVDMRVGEPFSSAKNIHLL